MPRQQVQELQQQQQEQLQQQQHEVELVTRNMLFLKYIEAFNNPSKHRFNSGGSFDGHMLDHRRYHREKEWGGRTEREQKPILILKGGFDQGHGC